MPGAALTCSNSTVLSRSPSRRHYQRLRRTPLDLAVLNITCANPGGNVSVTVDPGGQIVGLTDDGLGSIRRQGMRLFGGWGPPIGRSYIP